MKALQRGAEHVHRSGIRVNGDLVMKDPWQMTYEEFYAVYYLPAIRTVKASEDYTHEDLLHDTHQSEVLQAVLRDDHVPVENLKRYQFRVDTFKPIKSYCRRHRINL